ncbi:Dynein light chain [Clonorchis sinensis]|uniref:Dynein light chain n=2 Tax=Clonorchis sinensis TaxID=79923 RepID=A0A8T1MYU2_CLOSI|nr:Dynein light chain [Clonorchis sinensis]GAA57143.1 dynein light chain [Clonorchis sinensis]
MDERKAVIKVCELDERVADEAIHEAAYALDKYQDSKEVADHLKKYFDKKYERTWHCIIGNNFGSSITHGERGLLHFTLDNRTFLLYKWG